MDTTGLITAKEARRIVNGLEKQTTLQLICLSIMRAAQENTTHIKWTANEKLDDESCTWLENNGYEVWQRNMYRSYSYLIDWQDAPF